MGSPHFTIRAFAYAYSKVVARGRHRLRVHEADGEARDAGRVQAVDQEGDVKVTGSFVASLLRRG